MAVVAVHAACVRVRRAHLRREALGVVVTSGRSAAIFATGVAGYCHGNLIQCLLWIVIKLNLSAVVGMNSRAPGETGIIFTHSVIIPDEIEVGLGTPENLPAQSSVAIVTGIRLPAVDDPWFDLEFCCREILNAKAVEKPWRVGRNEGRLIGPVVKVVVTEQADIGNEDSGIYVQAVGHIPVIPSPSLRYVLVRVGQIPLAAVRAAVVADSSCGE